MKERNGSNYFNGYTNRKHIPNSTIYKGERLVDDKPEDEQGKRGLQYHTKLVGVTFEGRQEIIKILKGDEQLRVRREADNQYDPKAVAVDVLLFVDAPNSNNTEQWVPIGYIAKEKNSDVSLALDNKQDVEISLSSLTGGVDDKSFGVNVYLEYNKPEPKPEPVVEKTEFTKKSTNDLLAELLQMATKGEYEFNISAKKRSNTTYTSPLTGERIELSVVNGHKRLEGFLSGSQFPEKFYAPFDKKGILKAMADKFKVPTEAIEAMWQLNNEASTGYGTAIHAALENYDVNYELGHTIRSVEKKATKKNPIDTMGPNKAFSKNPFLKKIVEDFQNLFGGEYERVSEAFIWDADKKLCGSIDRIKVIDKEKKIIRIQDFKTDGDIHEKKYQLTDSPFYALTQGDTPKLGKELLDYHWFQLSFYAYILTLKGWTIEGLDVYWLNPTKLANGENAWEVFSREPLDLTGVL